MGSKKSLTYLISKFAILELLFTIFMILFSYTLLNVLINTGLVYPANYAEMNSDTLKEAFLKSDWQTDNIPFYYDYQLRENGKILESTIDEKYTQKINEALQKGQSSTDQMIGSDVFKVFKNGNRALIIKYKIGAMLANSSVYKVIGNFELVYFVSIFSMWLVGFVYFISHLTTVLRCEISKISKANESIEKLELEFEREYSEYTEISGVLDSIDSMARNLKASLEEQWSMQMTQKEMIESITHDVRTPITLIKGNIELLKENQENVLERAEDVLNGVERLESVLKKLNTFSVLMEEPKEVVSKEVLDHWIRIATSICKLKGFNLSILGYDMSEIKLDKNAVSVAIQNLVNNAIENSSVDSTIFIGFYDNINDYTIIVRDQGAGFNNGILYDVKGKFVSKKVDDNHVHGLGLSIVTKILDANKGQLLLNNYDDDGNGAEVKMVFKK
ncbi:sensor histidine kinase [Tuanshanicoccus lijuaniae]|uniref:sensor histidine kinase n=1 Tax=Aerococcaceae bacterium zg-1292 TaxID=2774330 RepID=UPI001BD85395|nr:HAMP domain-containing histidine kinase [Aerococcaceae bacterium zg-A91]MBS4457750.1 HAMP domain-containing histidine kinase [Aerococcaceae bacterium zg-BR33]